MKSYLPRYNQTSGRLPVVTRVSSFLKTGGGRVGNSTRLNFPTTEWGSLTLQNTGTSK